MLEDVLGWIVVLIGAVVMKFTDLWLIDPLLSIGVSLFILFNAIASLREILELFLEKTPDGISVSEIKEHLLNIDSVEDVHHIHVWTVDGKTGFATMHIVSAEDSASVKLKARAELLEHGISHATLEIERPGEKCDAAVCEIKCDNVSHSHHHHHHGHHHHHR
jgi:cobalt-zinc-cadmium efflux system protein